MSKEQSHPSPRLATLERRRDVLEREIAQLSADPLRAAGVRARQIELKHIKREIAENSRLVAAE